MEKTQVAEQPQIRRVFKKEMDADLDYSRSSIVREAGDLFGYRSVKTSILLATLRELDIQPLDASAVAKYKRSKETRTVKRRGWRETVKTTEWKAIPLGSYEGIVPEGILSKAVAIKKALPAVEMEVQMLTTRTQHNRIQRLPDPFLVAVLRGPGTEQRLFIDVWDEPEFETKLYA